MLPSKVRITVLGLAVLIRTCNGHIRMPKRSNGIAIHVPPIICSLRTAADLVVQHCNIVVGPQSHYHLYILIALIMLIFGCWTRVPLAGH